MPEIGSVAFALVGGILPALLWLWFWRREDRAHPEPRRLIALAFFAGMLTVAVVIPIQKAVAPFLPSVTLVFTAWSVIEEVAKYFAARLTVLNNPENNEPIDAVMYMIAVALGFAAIENALFLLGPISGGSIVQTILTDNLRFVGATLLHVLCSAVVGIALAFSYYRSNRIRALYAVTGVILASILHSTFNFLILNTEEAHIYRTFAFVWIGVVAVLISFEFIKRNTIRAPRRQYT